MKHFTMIFMATLTLAVLVYAQSQTPTRSTTAVTQKSAPATLAATPQEAQKAIEKGLPTRIAATATRSLKNYPSASKIGTVTDIKKRSLLEQGRRLLESGKSATTWKATQLSNYANQVDQYVKEVEAAAKAARPNGTTTPQEDCGAALRRCNDRCHAGDSGYFCFFDCRLEYMACLLGSLNSGSFGGVIMR